MTDPFPLPSTSGAQGPQAVQPGAAGARKAAVGGAGALAFKALLDQLDERAKSLAEESSKDLTKDDLAGAIDNARTSLEQMLTLKDQLLEAWRAAQAQTPAGDALPPRG